MNSSVTQKVVFVGIDWADSEHAFHLKSAANEQAGSFSQDAQAIQAQVERWRGDHPESQFAVVIETTKGPLISALLKYDDITIYPINPAALAAYRKAFAHGGGKNDPGDALLLCQYLEHYLEKLKPLRRDEPLTRKLAAMAEDRRRLVDQRTAHCNELKAVLKSYFPEVLQFGAASLPPLAWVLPVVLADVVESVGPSGIFDCRKYFAGVYVD